jgi:hypothetical protein
MPTSVHQVSSTEVAVNELSISQIGLRQIGIAQISTPQIGSIQKSPIQIGSAQISSAQISSIQISPIQISPTQIDDTQIDLTKISFPSSITLQQFLRSHNFNLQNTTIPTWTEFLTGTTPFNLNIEITDLPTGQLAEANITHFDPTGRPTSGTLTLDSDANGLGWFIDPTPWENSEFGTVNSETLFRATLGSKAYGHYDLLTTILHELGHLAGLISGNPIYDSPHPNQPFGKQ